MSYTDRIKSIHIFTDYIVSRVNVIVDESKDIPFEIIDMQGGQNV